MRRPPQNRGELALIDDIRRTFAGVRSGGVRLGIGDDCAILRLRPGSEALVTTDLTLEGRHFRRDFHSAGSAGHRCLARGLSDLAAMGADPVAAFLSLALPGGMTAGAEGRRWMRGFLAGVRALAERFSVPLAGGDTAEAPGSAIIADIVLVGQAPAGTALRRSGARPGDGLYVTGALGGAAAELRSMMAGGRSHARRSPPGSQPQSFPEPRLPVGRALRSKRLASACIDLSDGLSTDLRHICELSGVAAEVDAASLPLHGRARGLDPEAALAAMLHGGEDYELLFSAQRGARIPKQIAGVPVTRIGRIVRQRPKEPTVLLVDLGGGRKELPRGGWEHFRRS